MLSINHHRVKSASQLECKLLIDKLFKRKRFRQKEIDWKFFLKRLKRPWNRNRIYAVGEGGVGKTSVCNSLIGKAFSETEESTVGVGSLSFRISNAGVKSGGKGDWQVGSDSDIQHGESVKVLAKGWKKGEEEVMVSTRYSITYDNGHHLFEYPIALVDHTTDAGTECRTPSRKQKFLLLTNLYYERNLM
jgi:hypothetical protein